MELEAFKFYLKNILFAYNVLAILKNKIDHIIIFSQTNLRKIFYILY